MNKILLILVLLVNLRAYAQESPQTYFDLPDTISLSYALDLCDSYQSYHLREKGTLDGYHREGVNFKEGTGAEYFQDVNIRLYANDEITFKGIFKNGIFWNGAMGIWDKDGLLISVAIFNEGRKSGIGDLPDLH